MTRDPSNCAAPNNDVLARPDTAYTSAKSRSRLTGVVLASPGHLRQADSHSPLSRRCVAPKSEMDFFCGDDILHLMPIREKI